MPLIFHVVNRIVSASLPTKLNEGPVAVFAGAARGAKNVLFAFFCVLSPAEFSALRLGGIINVCVKT